MKTQLCFHRAYKGWVEEVLEGDGYIRDAKWSESIAVGSKSFVEKVKAWYQGNWQGNRRDRSWLRTEGAFVSLQSQF